MDQDDPPWTEKIQPGGRLLWQHCPVSAAPFPESVRPVPEGVVAAHRGASRLAPENTVSAFRTALANGAAALELDVQVTSDGQVIVLHDSRVDRTTDGDGAVRSLSAGQLGSLDAGSWYSSDFVGERVPTLEQVLELTRGKARLNIELKSAASDAERVIELVCRHEAVDRVVIMSFALGSVLAAKQSATSPRWRSQAAELTVLPIVTGRLVDPLAFVRSTGLDGLNYPPQYWDDGLIGRFRAESSVVHGGLINDPTTLTQFFHAGGQMADTDDPTLFGSEPGDKSPA